MSVPWCSGRVCGLVIIFLLALGCNEGPTTGTPIAGCPDGVAEVLVVGSTGAIEHSEHKFLEVVDRQDSKLVLVDFWASWCGPCKMLAPELEKIKRKWGDDVVLVKIDVDKPENRQMTRHLRVSPIPDVRIFRSGIQIGDFVGAIPGEEIESILKSLQ